MFVNLTAVKYAYAQIIVIHALQPLSSIMATKRSQDKHPEYKEHIQPDNILLSVCKILSGGLISPEEAVPCSGSMELGMFICEKLTFFAPSGSAAVILKALQIE